MCYISAGFENVLFSKQICLNLKALLVQICVIRTYPSKNKQDLQNL